ncbi:hypothetical protein CUAC110507_10510 [Cutibacterium acnes subsp. defendens]|uniref:Uncharacterized protein n=1 Tax=Cutibacterium acnes TaxID=1747 RepID=A0AA44ZDQ9_CUTAC|nr:hypothetical protein HMPREF9603_00061 [Cutibacterium acnes HL001PA1]EFT11391.1 hypothetical protein HMPREF9619_00105 [Cutibacterium acnes HL082PA2]EFT66722.1 hypothetical protein HMPREF9582_02232 [Cutibacterium acnes HL060PA1]ERS30834.1 hypothetical protein HMPREF1277_02032 [Propionibacterium sp. KPL1847]ERS65406.1 hypothetical protein HMPREF1278_02026 [Propionibacterium sp. KPL1849]MBD4631889.1 hypothetical protein [Xanthomonas citri pv. citri]PEN27694.1 hypothetical protein APS59_11035 [
MERITGAVAIRCGGTFALGGINPCSCVQPLCLSEGLQFKGVKSRIDRDCCDDASCRRGGNVGTMPGAS